MVAVRTRLMGLGFLALAPWASGQPLLLGRWEEVEHLWASELVRAALEAQAEAPSDQALSDLAQGLVLLAGNLRPHPDLQAQLETLATQVRQLAQEGPQGLRPLLPQAFQLLEQIQQVLVPQLDPPLVAGLLVQMALGEDGVAASYRGGFLGKRAAYRRGFFLLWRLQVLAEDLKPHLSPAAWSQVSEALAALWAVYPSSELPVHFRDPDEVREATLDLAYALEAGLGMDLLPRDPQQGLAHLRHLLEQVCPSPLNGGHEGAAWASSRLFFLSYLLPLLGPRVPGTAEALAQALREEDCPRLFPLLDEAGKGPWE
ncbi:hypothetical protein [Thermus caldilimi]|uniref:hypothetical protein n=1 Tax=Thermus caldilimi TaxID=2483360 RepID=UPI001075D6C3|nr:hypothetical protein [Thermus caldilimi]